MLHVNIDHIKKVILDDVVSKGLLREPSDFGSGPASIIN